MIKFLYSDKKKLAAGWLLSELRKSNWSTRDPETGLGGSGFVAEKLSTLAARTKRYDINTLRDACDILESDGFIKYKIKGAGDDVEIYATVESAQAHKEGHYLKVVAKKWVRRGLMLLGLIATSLGIYQFFKKSPAESEQRTPSDSTTIRKFQPK